MTPRSAIARRTGHDRPAHDANRRGFTLVELLVVIAIIVILLGLAAAVGPAVLGKSAEQTTRVRLQTLQSMYDGYLSITGQTNVDGSIIANMSEFLDAVEGVEGLKSSLVGLGGAVTDVEMYHPEFEDEDVGEDEWGFALGSVRTVLDGWNNPIFFKPADGMVGKGQAGQEDRYFFDPIGEFDNIRYRDTARFAKIPDIGQAYFASPGPDGFWGRVDMRPLPPDTVLNDPQFQERFHATHENWAIADDENDGEPDEIDQTREKNNYYSFNLDE